MPGSMRKVKDGYRVTWGGKVKAKHTTKAKAERQLRLLRGIEHGMKPKPRPRKKRRHG
jgi:hypothetical protein